RGPCYPCRASSICGEPTRRQNDVRNLRKDEVFQARSVREWDVVRRYAQHRRIEPLEARFADARRDLSRNSARARVLMHNEDTICLLHGRDDGIVIEWRERTKVNH